MIPGVRVSHVTIYIYTRMSLTHCETLSSSRKNIVLLLIIRVIDDARGIATIHLGSSRMAKRVG